MRNSLVSSLAICFLFVFCSKKEVTKTQPKKGNVTESVYASGIVKAENQYIVFSTVNGVLQSVNAEVGQTISEGQALFQIESDKANLTTENAQLAYQLSKQDNKYIQDKISEMETKVQAAKDKLALDLSIYNRNKNIKKYNIISEVDYERIELAYKNSKSSYEASVKQLAQLKSQVQNDQSRNSINLKISQKTKADYTIKSAFYGELFDVLVKKGAMVTTQTPLAIIGKKDSYLLELEVDENDMVRVKLGQTMLVSMDSYKGKVFEATVDKIYPIMDERSRTFKVEAHFIKSPLQLYPNLTTEANIVIRVRKDVVTIPKSYLIDGEYVLVNKDEKRKVKVGLSDYQNAEILSGLTVDETIYLPQ